MDPFTLDLLCDKSTKEHGGLECHSAWIDDTVLCPKEGQEIARVNNDCLGGDLMCSKTAERQLKSSPPHLPFTVANVA